MYTYGVIYKAYRKGMLDVSANELIQVNIPLQVGQEWVNYDGFSYIVSGIVTTSSKIDDNKFSYTNVYMV